MHLSLKGITQGQSPRFGSNVVLGDGKRHLHTVLTPDGKGRDGKGRQTGRSLQSAKEWGTALLRGGS
jgi:hypothetical protein